MTDKPAKDNDTTGDKIIKAREDERRRILASVPTIKTEIGFTSVPHTTPMFSMTIQGGDPDKLHALGQKLQQIALRELKNIRAAEPPRD